MSKGENCFTRLKSCMRLPLNNQQMLNEEKQICFRKESQKEKICFYPNFQILEKGIDVSHPKPLKCCEDQIHKEMFEFITKPEIRMNIERAKEAIFQIIILIYDNLKASLRVRFATGFYLKVNDEIKVVSVFHIFDDYKREFEEIIIFQNRKNLDLKEKISSYILKFGENMNYQEFKKLKKEIKNIYELKNLYINFKSLMKRQMWVSQNYRNSKLTLDPLFQLQPMPTLDLIILDHFDFEFEDKVCLFAAKDNFFPNETIFHIGYNSDEGFISKESDDYMCLGLNEPIFLSNIIYPNKSVSCGTIIDFNDGLIDFESSATEGSSGSPLLNIKGEVLGVTMGHFSDKEKGGTSKSKEGIFGFDLINRNERKSNYFCLKNTNIATRISHSGFMSICNEKSMCEAKFFNKKK